MLIPALATVTNIVFRKQPNLRDGITLAAAVATFLTVLTILSNVGNGTTEPLVLFEILPGIDIAFNVEPLGLLFAIVASGLWILTHIYGIGYMRGNNESHHARFFACFSFAISSVMGIAFASNMFTLFLFYELLTLSTYPLVAHKGTEEAIRGARTYLGILIGTSIGLQLVAVIWTYAITGTLDFTKGGILEGHISGPMVAILLALYAFGIGKAALMPFHRWLPAAMVAPTPVSALLHAVAVVKAGVFTMLKVGIYIFGIDFLAETGASEWLMWLAAFSIIAASVVAMTKDNLKARLAYSTVSQLSYITLGMALATSMGALGGGMHIAMHAMGKITLFMCAGSIYVATHKTNISQMTGLGRIMPITFGAFLIGALSIIGLPPLGGSWSKWLLIVGAADTGQWVMIGVLMASSLLNVAYLLPLVGRGFFLSDPDAEPIEGMAESPLLVWLPPAITAIGCIVLFFFAGDLQDFLSPIVVPN
ncbi:monovalent cation/H+ antiporter subunit D family protein [Pseudohalocynthiibacter aestuariivivens]|jgi:multicomponent Na+:H+ antiporter subunit D|nr:MULTISPECIES: monovalent cation/H+ antiporter subunit D family protein [Pseudohalocynthiibacter]MBS9718479.1 monovalent cation/H+ antiporter subunit D family protein [Pseudohalocynthiibacter aestuariivivens]MCK0104052.1 monovalent cation/H+ antiporter subunit D family protein [Pseudohalocynthiibacter sp. F2068]